MRRTPLLALLFFPAFSLADDGFLTNGGTPRLMGRHPSIRMARERVVIDVRPNGYHVDATFTFVNDGPACMVRMGFPDETSHDEDDPGPGKWAKAQASLEHFHSWVDGKPVPTTLLRSVADAKTWHVKNVAFAQRGTRRVRVSYDADGGGATSSQNGRYIRQVNYVMHTGASWKGPIGEAELIVRFLNGTLAGEILPVDAAMLKEGPYALSDWGKFASGTVFWGGFAEPTVEGRKLRFFRTRFEPDENDNLNLYFGFGHRFR